MAQRKKYLKISFSIMGFLVLVGYIVVCYGMMSTSEVIGTEAHKKWIMIIKNMVNAMFILFFIAHVTTLSLLIARLKATVPEFYKL